MDVLSNNTRKLYASLATAKGRRETGWFMAQGTKCVVDTIQYFKSIALLSTCDWQERYPSLTANIVKKSDLERITTLTSAPDVIAIYQIPEVEASMPHTDSLSIALDCIQDPGNLGTIMRVADWMGVTDIYASEDTVDVWSPKVVQATMGAISRVKVHYGSLVDFLTASAGMPVYGTFLEGENIYKASLTRNGIIVMGNEGNGISRKVEECVTQKLFIPSYPSDRVTSESLNVAIATAITLSEFRRNG